MKKAMMLLLLCAATAWAQFPDSSETRMKVVFPSASLTRPNNNTPYTAWDVVNDSNSTAQILRFVNAARELGGSGYVTGVKITTDSSNVTNGVFRLLICADSVTGIADNSPWTTLYANRFKVLWSVTLALETAGSGSTGAMATADGIAKPFRCIATSRNLFGVLIAEQAYTPGRLQKFTVTLSIDRQ